MRKISYCIIFWKIHYWEQFQKGQWLLKKIIANFKTCRLTASFVGYRKRSHWVHLPPYGKGNFQPTSALSSGLDAKGEVRKIIYLQEKKQLILLKNNAPSQLLHQKLIRLALSLFFNILIYADGKTLSHSGKYCLWKKFYSQSAFLC